MATRTIAVSEIITDLQAGLSRYKKGDLGFGSIEKKYGLTEKEMEQVINHPKIKDVETIPPLLVLVDDVPEPVPSQPSVEPEVKTKIEVTPVVKSVKYVAPKQEEKQVAFI